MKNLNIYLLTVIMKKIATTLFNNYAFGSRILPIQSFYAKLTCIVNYLQNAIPQLMLQAEWLLVIV